MIRTKALLFLLLILAVPLMAGPDNASFVQAFRDFRNFLYVFDNGIQRQVEQQPVRSFKTRGSLLVYADNANDLIAYYKGEKFNLGDMTATTYEVMPSYMYYRRDLLLSIFDRGQTTALTYFLRDFSASDSLIAFRDRNFDVLKVYYNGAVHELEVTLAGSLVEYKTGENTVAYITRANLFKVYLDDHVYDLDNMPPMSYEPGGNLVAYVDGLYNYLKVFYNGRILVLEKIIPVSYKAGVDVLAYVADNNAFKVFTGGKLLKVEDYVPDFYTVRDRTVLFFFNNHLQVLLDGVRYELDEFRPQNYQMSENNVAWIDPARRLHIFSEGKTTEVTRDAVKSYELNGNTLRFDLPDGSSRVWYKGKIYGN